MSVGRNSPVWSYLAQRNEYEGSAAESWMGKSQFWIAADPLAIEKEVDIEGSGAVSRSCYAARQLFQAFCQGQECLGG